MKRLTEVDKSGSWSIAGIKLGNVKGNPYGALCKLKAYEDTGLTPEEIIDGKLLTGWIEVEERLPDEPECGIVDMDSLKEYIVMIDHASLPTFLLYAGDGEWYRDGDFYKVLAWMPLPGSQDCSQLLNKMETGGKMKRLRFEGCSDDTFGEYGVTHYDVDNCASMEPIQCVVDCGESGRLMVIGQYSKASCNNGCWMIGVSKVEEYDNFPSWDMYLGQSEETPYSISLQICLPEGFCDLTWYKNGNKVDV